MAAAVHFQLGERGIYKYGASSERLQHLCGANLVIWEAIEQLARNSARTPHLSRISLGNEGLRRFKLGWGGGERRIEYAKYELREGCFVTETDAASGRRSRVFRALPLRVLDLIGATLCGHCA